MLGRLCMENTALQFYALRRFVTYTKYASPLPNHIQPNPHHLRAHTSSAAGEEAISLRRRRPPNPIARQSRALMADDKAAKSTPQSESAAQDKSEKSPPPPPEKPLPGDCCGSGCVRCVWDVYYDDLEEYNKLYKSDSDPKSKPS
ncbi:hypothetical protein TIFTF001_002354 [Ficus carica]|uniref:Oxidoreductase-like domain-containing protein n=1 Tax=Ficus carica TaxID=3494 RepID=A0AA88CTK2_FICCA|nr:hypothetical protein TIFTF001_002354 [Ficus carica]